MATRSKGGLGISRRGDTLTLDFGGGATVRVDLKQAEMNSAQNAILNKLIRAKPGFTLAACTGDTCPAGERLSQDEFKQIRGLKAKLGTSGELAGLICDFCLKCVAV